MVWKRIGPLLKSLAGVAEGAPAGEAAISVELATAVLLHEIARADFDIADHESAVLRRLLAEESGLDDDECEVLLRRAEALAGGSASLHDFIDTLNRRLDAEGRRRLMRMIWQVAYADGHLDAHEDHLARRLAELLHVPHSAFIQEKLAVAESRQPR